MFNPAPPDFYWRNVVIENYDDIINELRDYAQDFIIGKPPGFNVCNNNDLIHRCPTFSEWLILKQLTLKVAAVIHIVPRFSNIIHVDNMEGATNPYALNLDIQNCSCSTTKMFSTSGKIEKKFNLAGIPYMYLDPKTCKEEASFKIINPILFDASKPHQVCDVEIFPRTSISFRFFQDPSSIL